MRTLSRRALFGTVLGGAALCLRGEPVTAPDDLTSLFSPPPSGPSQDWRFRQGVIKAWDPVTLENQVSVGGTILFNLPVLGVAETATLEVDDVVAVAVIGSEASRTRTYCIVGQMVIPDTPEAESALSFLSTRIYASDLDEAAETTNTSFGDPNLTGSPGPTVEHVIIGPSGKALVTVGALCGGASSDSGVSGARTVNGGAFMGYEISGPTNRAAANFSSVMAFYFNSVTPDTNLSHTAEVRASKTSLETGLTPGAGYTFQAKYKMFSGNGTQSSAYFEGRTIIVQAL